jgi:hypothetical protein
MLSESYCKHIGFDTIAVAFDPKHTGNGAPPFFSSLNESVPCLTKTCNPYSKSNAST